MLESLLSLYLLFAGNSDAQTNLNAPDSLIVKVEELTNKRDYAAALPIALQSVNSSEKAYGTNDWRDAVPLNDLAYVYDNLSQYTNAETFYLRALRIREATVGSNHLYTASVLINMADMYEAMGRYERSAELYQRAAQIVGEKYGQQSAEYGKILAELAWIKEKGGDFQSAKSIYQKAIDIQSAALGGQSLRRLSTLCDYATVCTQLAEYGKAEQTLLEVLPQQERAYGTNSPKICNTLNAFGILYEKIGELEKAEACHRRVLGIFESLPEQHQDGIITCYNNIGLLRLRMGDFATAEEYLLKSIHLTENLHGPNCPELVEALNNLATLYREINNYKKAEDTFNLAINIHEANETNDELTTSKLLVNLADVYTRTADWQKADKLYGASLQICKNKIGRNHPETAIVLREWADMCKMAGLYDKAKPMFEDALNIEEQQLGDWHPDTLVTQFDLAALYCDTGDYLTSDTLFRKALFGMQRTFGTNAFQTFSIENSLALVEAMLHHNDEALAYAKSERYHSELNLARTLAFTSAEERALNRQNVRSPLDMLAQLGSVDELAEGILRGKGVILDSDIEDQLAARASIDPQIKSLLERLKQQSRRLNNVMLATRGDIEHERADQQQIYDDLQKDILKRITSLGQNRRALAITVSKVQEKLSPNTRLLEFLWYDRYLGHTQFDRCFGVVLVGPKNQSVWIPLGSATNLEANLHDYETLMRSRGRGDERILKELYVQIMTPVFKQLPSGVTNLIISPDAELNFLSFATLMDEQGDFLGEHYNVSYVASGRDMVYGRQVKSGNGQLAVFANIDFNAAPYTFTNSNSTELAMMDGDRRDYDGIILRALPSTAVEAEYLRSHSPNWKLNTSLYLGSAATEAQVKALHSPYILHLATHGFFLPDNIANRQTHLLGPGEKMPVILQNPMQRSGLALAGAQTTLDAWKRGEVPDTENDGILMAEEVGLLDLQNTWLVTLSACDTGIGEARAGEGVMGLRRGFIQAGAQNLLMTLWPVSDKWTVDLMEAFYDEAMKTKDAPGALASVQRDFLKRLKQEKGPVMAARLAGPFVMNFQGKPGNN